MKGYIVMVSEYFHTCDDTFDSEVTVIVHSTRELARKELISLKRDINLNNEFASMYIKEVLV